MITYKWIFSAFDCRVDEDGMQDVVTPDGISVLDPELHFGELSDVLWTLTV